MTCVICYYAVALGLLVGIGILAGRRSVRRMRAVGQGLPTRRGGVSQSDLNALLKQLQEARPSNQKKARP